MKINYEGVSITGMYMGAAVGRDRTSFSDEDGARITINTKLIVHLYELIKFDLEKRNGKTMDEMFPV